MTWQGQPAATVDLVLGDYVAIERYMRQRFHEALAQAGVSSEIKVGQAPR
jgi:hypothetical protein